MKYIILIIIGGLLSCNNQQPKESKIEKDLYPIVSDTININEPYIFWFNITGRKVDDEKLKYQAEDEFYITTDDITYYFNESLTFLNSQSLPIIEITDNVVLNFGNKIYINSSDISYLNFIFYKSDTLPIIVPPIDAKFMYEEYFESDYSLQSRDSLFDELNMTSWSPDCESNYYVYFDLAGAQFQFDTKFTISTSLKWKNKNTYDVYFFYPIIRPIPNNMIDCIDYSEDIAIAQIELKDNNHIEFRWLGFYNQKKQRRVHTENPFGKEKEYSILKRCDNK